MPGSASVKGREVVFVGIGLPNLACNLARRMHAPASSSFTNQARSGLRPTSSISIGDPALGDRLAERLSMFDIFSYYLQGGLIDVGFCRARRLIASAISTRPWWAITLSLWCGCRQRGACEIAILARRVLIIAPQDKRSFPERVDFITSPLH